MGECKNCSHKSHLHSPSCRIEGCPCIAFVDEPVHSLGWVTPVPKSACDACGQGGLLLSADGTESCDTWNCIRCHIHMVIHQEVAALGIKELVRDTIIESVDKAMVQIMTDKRES